MSEIWRSKRPLIRANLRRVLGPQVDEATLERIVAKAFDSYAHYWVEASRVGALRSDQIETRFSVEGFERFREHMARGRGVVLALPHVGSWEYGGRWLAQQGYPMTTVGELLEPPELFDWFTSQRAELGLTVLPPGPDTTVRLLDTLRSGRVVGLLADRDLAGNGVEVEFFGEKTTLPGGPALLVASLRRADHDVCDLSAPTRPVPRCDPARPRHEADRAAPSGRATPHRGDGPRSRGTHPPGARTVAPLPAELAFRPGTGPLNRDSNS